MDTSDKKMEHETESSPGSADTINPPPEQRVIRSEDLFQGKREMFIQHGEQVYRLMETKNGKLILQK